MKRTDRDNGRVVEVKLPKIGDYIIDEFDILDNNLLKHVRCTHVTRRVEKTNKEKEHEEALERARAVRKQNRFSMYGSIGTNEQTK
ncbi:hypothetical protein LSAT2_021843 [Lamellibrachia satsuma]|nr:hypothetical protein LSAT2_021843 [Lamellibrachia satsuma]